VETLVGTNATVAVNLYLPGGGVSYFQFSNGWATNYYNNYQLHVITNGAGAVLSYELLDSDGSKIV